MSGHPSSQKHLEVTDPRPLILTPVLWHVLSRPSQHIDWQPYPSPEAVRAELDVVSSDEMVVELFPSVMSDVWLIITSDRSTLLTIIATIVAILVVLWIQDVIGLTLSACYELLLSCCGRVSAFIPAPGWPPFLLAHHRSLSSYISVSWSNFELCPRLKSCSIMNALTQMTLIMPVIILEQKPQQTTYSGW